MRPLDFAPFPGGPARSLFRPASSRPNCTPADAPAARRRLAVDFASYSPRRTLEWRGHRTVQALVLLRANGVL